MTTATTSTDPIQPMSPSGGFMSPRHQRAQAPVAPAGTGNYQIRPARSQPPAPATSQVAPVTATAPAAAAPSAAQQAATAAQSFNPQSTVAAPAPLTGGSTVEGRLTDLLSSDSKYMQTARDYALQNMNKRGLMQSSIAVGASQDAAIRAGLPIAAQDAQAQAAQDSTHLLHRYDLDKLGADTAASSLLSTQGAAQDTAAKVNEKDYVQLGAAANDRYAQEFSAIQQSSMTAEQKALAVTELKKWKIANDNWLNQTYAQLNGSTINMTAFTSSAAVPVTAEEALKAKLTGYGVSAKVLAQAAKFKIPLINSKGQYLASIGSAFNKNGDMAPSGVYKNAPAAA